MSANELPEILTCLFSYSLQVPQLQLRGRVQPVADDMSVGLESRLADELVAVGHVSERRQEYWNMYRRGIPVVRHVQDIVGLGREYDTPAYKSVPDTRNEPTPLFVWSNLSMIH